MGAGDFQVDGLRILNAGGVEIAVVRDFPGAQRIAIGFAHAPSILRAAGEVVVAVRKASTAHRSGSNSERARNNNIVLAALRQLIIELDALKAHAHSAAPPTMN